MRFRLLTTLLATMALLAAGAAVAQSPTPLGCDGRCLSALSRLSPGMPVDIWSDNVRVRGTFTGILTNPREGPRLIVRSDDPSGDTASTVIAADHVQSLNVGISNAPLFAVYGAAGGATIGVAAGMLDALVGFFRALTEPDRPASTGGRLAAFIALGAGTGALAGAMIGSASHRWEQWFARPANADSTR